MCSFIYQLSFHLIVLSSSVPNNGVSQVFWTLLNWNEWHLSWRPSDSADPRPFGTTRPVAAWTHFVPERSFFGHLNARASVGVEIAEMVGRLSTQRSKSDQKSCFAFQSTLTCRPNEFSSGFQVVTHRFTQVQARRLSCQSWYMQTNAPVFFVGSAFLWRRQFYGGLKRSLITGEMEEQV